MARVCCYLLTNGRRTYVGKTNDIGRRLRQHNGELAGGARTTRGQGPWALVWTLDGFVNERDALQFEYRLHHPRTRWRPGVAGRTRSVYDAAALERATTSAPLNTSRTLRLVVDATFAEEARTSLGTCTHDRVAFTLAERADITPVADVLPTLDT